MLIAPHPADVLPKDTSTVKDACRVAVSPIAKSMEDYLGEVRRLFSHELEAEHLHELSSRLQLEFKEKLQCSDISMLPSYHHTLPTGEEQGTFLALDVGGSNFRLALIELRGKDAAKHEDLMQVRHSMCFPIDDSVRALHGNDFFEWMADRIAEILETDEHKSISPVPADKPLPMGLAWSFPIEQTSSRSGRLLTMGKGFSATVGVQGQDLCDLLMPPCESRGLNVRLRSLVNDSSASLLSQAYRDTSTRMSLILGTGTNSSVYLPVSAVSSQKLGARPRSWHDAAQHVVVNTELSMHGGAVWPLTRWDKAINAAHELPGFQPFEYLVGGRYLGEIVRLILVEAVHTAGFFEGTVPPALSQPYSLDTSILSAFESDTTPDLRHAQAAFGPLHRTADIPTLTAIRDIASLVSTRAAAYEAAAVHALWELCCAAELATGSAQVLREHVTIACNGSILEKYPGFRGRCQGYLDALTGLSLNTRAGRTVELAMANESSMFGAAVAAACEAT